MICGSRCNIGKAPCRLELKLWNLMVQQLDENWQQVGVDDGLNWGHVLDRQQLPHSNAGKELHIYVIYTDELT